MKGKNILKEVQLMIDQKKIIDNLKEIEKLAKKGDSPQLDELWEEIVEMFGENLEKTMSYFSECKENEILVLADFFEDISCELQSKAFISLLREIQVKFPDLDIDQDIQWAKEAIT